MTLADIIQMQVDRRNGVMLAPTTIDKLIVHAVMREAEAPHLYERIESLKAELAQTKAILAMATKQGEAA